jgi:hypothetical protein
MATKKTASKAPKTATPAPAPAPAAPHPSGLTGPVKDGSEIYFSRADLARIEAVQAKATIAKQAAELHQAAIEKVSFEFQLKAAALRDKMRELVADYQAKTADVSKLYSDVSEVYKADMAKLAYDPITGRINALS